MLRRSLLLVTICVFLDLTAGRSCPYGFVGYRSSCYLFSHEGTDYAGAHALCDYFSSRLARITSFDEELFLRGYLKRNGDADGYYVDGTDLRVEGVWTWDKPYGRMTYLNWYPGEPSRGNDENCLVLWRGYGYRKKFGFVGHGSSCYLFSNSEATFEGAHAFCDYFSSRLARITNIGEENFISGYLQRNRKEKGYFVDGTDMRVEGVWTWDKPFQKMTYFNWYPGRPNGQTRQDCLVLWSNFKYRFTDIECSMKLRFVCETQKK